MPVRFRSAATFPTDDSLTFTTSSGSVEGSINVSPAPDLLAAAAIYWSGTDDVDGMTFAASLGGEPMTALDDAIITWDSNRALLKVFTLANPPTGADKSVVASFSGASSSGLLVPVAVLYSGVESVGTPVTAGGSASTANSVEVDSTAEAHRVVTIHAAGSEAVSGHGNIISDYAGVSNTLRARGVALIGLYSTFVVVQDAAGDDTVTGTATNFADNEYWGAVGFDLVPAVVVGDVQMQVSNLGMSATGSTFRAATPSPLRTWVIK